MDKVRIGIIGCGGIANGKHLPALKRNKYVEMVAFCDIVAERAEKAAAEYGTEGAKSYTDYKDLLADDSIDAVHVLTPNREHSFITVDALHAGQGLCRRVAPRPRRLHPHRPHCAERRAAADVPHQRAHRRRHRGGGSVAPCAAADGAEARHGAGSRPDARRHERTGARHPDSRQHEGRTARPHLQGDADQHCTAESDDAIGESNRLHSAMLHCAAG